jgi:1,4-dihydroxy-2-naphthoyl-CoA synthase
MNSFCVTLTEMREAVKDAAADDSVGVLVITGADDQAFCAGACDGCSRCRWRRATPMDPHAGIEDFINRSSPG